MSEHVHGPDCDHDHDDEEQTFIITDEEGIDHEMIMIYTFESDDRHYAVLIEKNDPEAEGLIFRIEQENEDVYLVTIDDDQEWERVVTVYNELVDKETAES